MKKYSDFNKY